MIPSTRDPTCSGTVASRIERIFQQVRRYALSAGLMGFLVWLGANLLLCEFQVRCGVPVNHLPWLAALAATHLGWLVPGLAGWVVLSAVGIGLELRWRHQPPQTRAARIFGRVFGVLRVIYQVPIWLLLLGLVCVGFLVDRQLFFELLLGLSLVGIAQALSRRLKLSPARHRLVFACSALVTVGILAARFWSELFVAFVPRSVLLLAGLLMAIAGAGLVRIVTPHPGGLAWYAHQARCGGLLLFCGVISLGQLFSPNARCRATTSARSGVQPILRSQRAFDVVTCSDPRFVYVSFDWHKKLVRVALNPSRDGPPRTLQVGNSGVIRPVCDRARARLFVPVLVPQRSSRLLIVDEASFRVVREIRTPKGDDYRIFDIALDRVGRQVLVLTKAGYLLSYKFGGTKFVRLANLGSWFALPYSDHIVIRIAVNEQRRVAYICPWPLSTTKLLELDLRTGRVIRQREMYDFASAVKVIGEGRELLVALPFRQEVHRLDAASFRLLRTYSVGFSARDLAVDEKRGLLLVGNFTTGTVNLIRLADGNNLGNWHVGPAVRGVHLDAATGQAFAATQCGACRIRLP